ncbi:hypothetical protein WISP_05389 [Willisornis vidua]|uniref:Uncharacterized protein n=1 Tax=Willisornis vidua TaxID=1566151 RepID=A0ABQ9DYY9_9PASS|nr:hypothetical protein WISP_05389 [Willisornis vidua]
MESTLDPESQGCEFESQLGTVSWQFNASLPIIRSRQILDAEQGQPQIVPGAVDSPKDFTVTVQARLAVANGP